MDVCGLSCKISVQCMVDAQWRCFEWLHPLSQYGEATDLDRYSRYGKFESGNKLSLEEFQKFLDEHQARKNGVVYLFFPANYVAPWHRMTSLGS